MLYQSHVHVKDDVLYAGVIKLEYCMEYWGQESPPPIQAQAGPEARNTLVQMTRTRLPTSSMRHFSTSLLHPTVLQHGFTCASSLWWI